MTRLSNSGPIIRFRAAGRSSGQHEYTNRIGHHLPSSPEHTTQLDGPVQGADTGDNTKQGSVPWPSVPDHPPTRHRPEDSIMPCFTIYGHKSFQLIVHPAPSHFDARSRPLRLPRLLMFQQAAEALATKRVFPIPYRGGIDHVSDRTPIPHRIGSLRCFPDTERGSFGGPCSSNVDLTTRTLLLQSGARAVRLAISYPPW